MSSLKLFHALYKMNVLTPKGLFHLAAAILHNGLNVMALLHFAARIDPEKIALADDRETLSYQQLFIESKQLAHRLPLKNGQKVGFLCRNHASLVKAIFAASRLGASIYLLNTEMGKSQIKQALELHDFDLFIYDEEFQLAVEESSCQKLLALQGTFSSLHNFHPAAKSKLKRVSGSKIMLLTGGTTGKSKEVEHKQTIHAYLSPFLGLLNRMKLLDYHTAYIATPIYHGYGIAILFSFIALGKKVVITDKFAAQHACTLIRKHKVDFISVVPLMVRKMLKVKDADLSSLSCIASGGALLHASLTKEVREKLGAVLYNLYGTTETGLNIIATPQDLKAAPQTLGRKINGVPLAIMDQYKRKAEVGAVGEISLKTRKGWIGTGDLAYQDRNGLIFLNGRMDEMVVSGGENVYPIELEQVMISHPEVEEVAVVGVHDKDFGQRLKAFVVPAEGSGLAEAQLMEWLKPRVARYHMPKEIVFLDTMPYTSVGKMDKKKWNNKKAK